MATEIRKVTAPDCAFGTGNETSVEGHVGAKINASHIPMDLGAVSLTVNDALQAWADVRMYGAVGDGITNDAAAFILALAGGNKTVYVPDGEWVIGGTHQYFTLENNTTILMGKGAILSFEGTDATYRNGFHIAGVHDISIIGGTLKGNKATSAAAGGLGIRISGSVSADAYNILIDGVNLFEWKFDGVQVGGGTGHLAYNVRVVNSIATNCGRTGMTAAGGYTRDVSFISCVAEGTSGSSPQSGFHIEPDTPAPMEKTSFIDCTARGCAGSGFYLQDPDLTGTKETTVIGGFSYGNAGSGLMMAYLVGAVVKGFTAYDNGGAGIVATGCSQLVVNGNWTYSNATNNIEINSTVDSTFDANVSIDSAGEGIVARTGCYRISIQGNVIRNPDSYGIQATEVYDSIISNNLISTAWGSGVVVLGDAEDCTVNGNHVIDCNRQAGATVDGLTISGVRIHADGNTIRGSYRWGMIVNGTDCTANNNDAICTWTSMGVQITGTGSDGAGNRGKNAPKSGRAILVAGAVTVSTAEVVATDKILLTCIVVGGTQGMLSVGTITAGASFVINSSNAADTSTVFWEIRH